MGGTPDTGQARIADDSSAGDGARQLPAAGLRGSTTGDAPRLVPTMSSRKLLALDFIKRYFADWGYSPTLGELASFLSVSTKRAHDLVHSLAVAKMIEHEAGKPRGIRLPDRGAELSEADVLLRLSAMGWTIGQGARMLLPPGTVDGPAPAPDANPAVPGLSSAFPLLDCDDPLMEKELHRLPRLDHDEAQAGMPRSAGGAAPGRGEQADHGETEGEGARI